MRHKFTSTAMIRCLCSAMKCIAVLFRMLTTSTVAPQWMRVLMMRSLPRALRPTKASKQASHQPTKQPYVDVYKMKEYRAQTNEWSGERSTPTRHPQIVNLRIDWYNHERSQKENSSKSTTQPNQCRPESTHLCACPHVPSSHQRCVSMFVLVVRVDSGPKAVFNSWTNQTKPKHKFHECIVYVRVYARSHHALRFTRWFLSDNNNADDDNNNNNIRSAH